MQHFKSFRCLGVKKDVMNLWKSFLLIIALLDLEIAFTQPLAPRNRTKKKPVLETFSGCRCNICTYSDPACKNLLKQNCGFSWINYHAGPFAVPKDSSSPDLRTPCGTAIHDSFRINAYPTGMINRILGPLYYNDWYKIYYPQFNDFAVVNIGVETLYDSNVNQTNINVELYRFEEYKDSVCFLSVMVVEDGVIAPQLQSANQWIDNYLHPNVFRDHITSCFGDKIDTLRIESPLQRHYSYSIPKHINPKKAFVVAIITDTLGRVINSEVQPMTGGRTRVDAYFEDEEHEDFAMKQNDSLSQLVHFTSLQKDSVEYCFIINKTVQEWQASITINNVKSFDAIRMKLAGGQTIEIDIELAAIPVEAFGKLHFEILPYCVVDSCYTRYFKELTIQPVKPILVIYNTAKNRDGTISKVNLWKPIADVLDQSRCNEFVVIRDTDFEDVYTFRQESQIPVSAIYYAAGWGQSIFPDSTMRYLDRLMKNGTDLFLAGQDVAYLLGSSQRANPFEYINWFENTLGVYFVKDGDTTYTEVKMDDRDPLFGSLGSSAVLPVFQNGTQKNITPDVIRVDPRYGRRFLYNNKGTNLGFYRELDESKMVLICAGMEMLGNKDFVSGIINATNDWFDACNVNIKTDVEFPDPKIENEIDIYLDRKGVKIIHPAWDGSHTIFLVNLEGKVLLNSKIGEATSFTELEIVGLKPGMYFYVIFNGHNQIQYKGKLILLN